MDLPAPGNHSIAQREELAASAEHKRFIASATIVAALGLWVPQLASSFWADETVTHWIVKGSAHEALSRASTFEGESPLYFLIANLWRRLVGTGEVALRIPSFLAMAAAAILEIGRAHV